MRHAVFRNGKHGQDIAAKGALDGIQVDVGKVFVLDLFSGVVDEDVDGAVPGSRVREERR